jgi:hypothetical protein
MTNRLAKMTTMSGKLRKIARIKAGSATGAADVRAARRSSRSALERSGTALASSADAASGSAEAEAVSLDDGERPKRRNAKVPRMVNMAATMSEACSLPKYVVSLMKRAAVANAAATVKGIAIRARLTTWPIALSTVACAR